MTRIQTPDLVAAEDDLERSLRFYEETLGLAVYREWGRGRERGVVFFLGGGLLEVSGSSAEPSSSEGSAEGPTI